MAFFVKMSVKEPLVLAIRPGRNDWKRTLGFDRFNEVVGFVTLVCQEEVGLIASYQGFCLPDVMHFRSREAKAQWVAECIDHDMNLAAKAATTTS
jgi:hypothetical protein